MTRAVEFRQAKHYRLARRTSVDLIVIHSAEIGESLEGAEALMRVCAVNERVASWHYAVDADTITQSVREADVAFHAPGANHNGIGVELSGRARQTREEWQDPFSFHMLELCAELCAGICKRWDIPAVFVPREVLRLPNARGITTHAEVSKAFGKSDHWDPGPNFPIAWLLERVGHYSRAGDTEPAPAPLEETDP
jgi:N-acetyl-anhydromuramyl-L-alanine amidase AmpD